MYDLKNKISYTYAYIYVFMSHFSFLSFHLIFVAMIPGSVKLDLNSPCNSGWSWPQIPASLSWALGLQKGLWQMFLWMKRPQTSLSRTAVKVCKGPVWDWVGYHSFMVGKGISWEFHKILLKPLSDLYMAPPLPDILIATVRKEHKLIVCRVTYWWWNYCEFPMLL